MCASFMIPYYIGDLLLLHKDLSVNPWIPERSKLNIPEKSKLNYTLKMRRYVQSWIPSILLITAVIVGSHAEHGFTFILSELITFNAAGVCSAYDRSKMLQKISKFKRFHCYIWNHNEKCIQISTNMPGIGFKIGERDVDIWENEATFAQ